MSVTPAARRAFGGRLPLLCALVALAVLAVVAAGCGRMQAAALPAQGDLALGLTVEPDPPVVGPGLLLVSLADRDGNPLHGAQVTAEGNMAMAGMAPVFAGSTGEDGARYRLPLSWTMAGDWIVDVRAKLPDGRVAARRFTLVVRSGS